MKINLLVRPLVLKWLLLPSINLQRQGTLGSNIYFQLQKNCHKQKCRHHTDINSLWAIQTLWIMTTHIGGICSFNGCSIFVFFLFTLFVLVKFIDVFWSDVLCESVELLFNMFFQSLRHLPFLFFDNLKVL